MAYPDFLPLHMPDYVDTFMGIRKGFSDMAYKNSLTQAKLQDQALDQWKTQIAQDKANQDAANNPREQDRADASLLERATNDASQREQEQARIAIAQRAQNTNQMLQDLAIADKQKAQQQDVYAQELSGLVSSMAPDDFSGDLGRQTLTKYNGLLGADRTGAIVQSAVAQRPELAQELNFKSAYGDPRYKEASDLYDQVKTADPSDDPTQTEARARAAFYGRAQADETAQMAAVQKAKAEALAEGKSAGTDPNDATKEDIAAAKIATSYLDKNPKVAKADPAKFAAAKAAVTREITKARAEGREPDVEGVWNAAFGPATPPSWDKQKNVLFGK